MKKALFILLFVSCMFGAVAETGYNGLQWNTDKSRAQTALSLVTINDSTCKDIKVILGKLTTVYYHIRATTLIGISYTIQREKTKSLIKKYGKRIESYRCPSFSRNEVEDWMKSEELSDFDFFINSQFDESVWAAEKLGLSEFKSDPGNGKGTVHIYDYNDDTRVYIFENIVEGLTLVYYTYHEQDY